MPSSGRRNVRAFGSMTTRGVSPDANSGRQSPSSLNTEWQRARSGSGSTGSASRGLGGYPGDDAALFRLDRPRGRVPEEFQFPLMNATVPARQESRDTWLTDTTHSSSSRQTTGLASPMYVHDWTVDDVGRWLGGHGLAHCISIFRENRITGDVLLDIGREDLQEMGICALGDRMRIVKAIEQLQVDTKQVVGGVGGPSALDFLFLGASPLVTVDDTGNAARPLELIDLEAEQQAIKKAIIDANRICRFQFEFATLRRLSWAVLHRSCSVLIFSGHTLPNGHWLLETETGESLTFDPFELFQYDETSAIAQEDRSQAQLSEGTPASKTTSQVRAPSGALSLRLVVLCSCHSCIPAKLFIDAGVPHVIAVERMETVLDVSARVFVQSLCHSLLVGNTIQSAFKHAQWLVKQNECLHTAGQRATAKAEAQKFVLLPKGANHATVLFPSLPRGTASNCSACPPPVQFPRTRFDLTVIRQVELWKVLHALRNHRFVQVLGAPGVGKRTLVCLVAHYVWQRHLFPDGVHYIHVDDLRWIVALDWSLRRMFPLAGSPNEADSGNLVEAATSSTWKLQHEAFLSQRLSLPGYRLLILDGCHGLYEKCGSSFVRWLSHLLAENPGLQVLITARKEIQIPASCDDLCDDLVRATASPGESVLEVGELSEADAIRLLRWRCHVLPEALAFLDEHGARLVALCGRMPLALCVCARWLIKKLPRSDPRNLLETLTDSTKRLRILEPCTVLFDAAIKMLPAKLAHCLRVVAGLHSAFSVDLAAALWGVDKNEAQLWLDSLVEQHLLEASSVRSEDGTPIGTATAQAAATHEQPPQATLYRMQELVRLHVRNSVSQEAEDQKLAKGRALTSGISELGTEYVARLVAAYLVKLTRPGHLWRQEFPNIQLVLDIAGASCSFLVVLWAIRGMPWVHAWLGDARRAKLYERALAVLAKLTTVGESDAATTADTRQTKDGGERKGVGVAAALPSDAFVAAGPDDVVDPSRAEDGLRTALRGNWPYRKNASWEELKSWIFHDGSNLDPREVWGDAPADESQPLVHANGELDGWVFDIVKSENDTITQILADLRRPEICNRFAAEALLEISSATRGADPAHALKLSYCATARLSWQRSSTQPSKEKEKTEAQQVRGKLVVGANDATLLSLLADSYVEFALCALTVRGYAACGISTSLLNTAVKIGQQIGPLRKQHKRNLRAATFHALVVELDPVKAEGIQKQILEAALQKLNTWHHPDIAEILHESGLLCHALGDLQHAESMLRTTVSIWRQIPDAGLQNAASAYADLGNLLTEKDRWSDAEELYRQAMAVQNACSENSILLYKMQNRLARLYMSQGKCEAALPLLKECLKGVEKAVRSGARLPVAAVRHNVAQCLLMSKIASKKEAGIQMQARDLLEKVVGTYETYLPDTHPSTIAARCNLGRAHLLLNDAQKAIDVLEHGFRSMLEAVGYSDREVGRVRFLLGRAYLELGRAGEGRNHFEWVHRNASARECLSEAEQKTLNDALHAKDAKCEKGSAECNISDVNPNTSKDAILSPVSSKAAKVDGGVPESSHPAGDEEPHSEPASGREALRPDDNATRQGHETTCCFYTQADLGDHCGFCDVDERSIPACRRSYYLMGSRILQRLGVLPHQAGRGWSASGANVAFQVAGITEADTSLVLSAMSAERRRWSA